MTKTYFLDDGAATHAINDGSGIIIGTTLLAASALGTGTLDFLVPNGPGVSRKRFFEEDQDLDVTRVSTGTVSVEVNVTTAFADHIGFVRLHRVNSSGAIQNTGAETASQSWATTGVKTYVPAITALGTWVSTDRLVVEVRVENANLHGGDDLSQITIGTTDAQAIATDFTGPPAISSASMADSGRDWTTPYQEVAIVFDRAMEKSGGVAYGVGDTIPGLTVGPSGTEGAVTYRSGDSTATWVVRRAAQALNGNSWVIDYARSTGEIVGDGGGGELLDTTNSPVTNNLTKRIRATLKNDAGTAITTAVDFTIQDAVPRDSDDAAWMAILQRHPNVTPTAGLIDVEAITPAVGDPVYIVVFNPREDATGGATSYARTAAAVVTVT